MRRVIRPIFGLGILLVLALALVGCGKKEKQEKAPLIAFLAPRGGSFINQDFPAFRAQIRQLCPQCWTIFFNARKSVKTQEIQIQSALHQDAEVLVIAPSNFVIAANLIQTVRASDVALISYGHEFQTSLPLSFSISPNLFLEGKLAAQGLLAQSHVFSKTPPGVLVLTAPGQSQALEKGALATFRGQAKIRRMAASQDTPEAAKASIQKALKDFGAKNFTAIYAASDNLALGATQVIQNKKLSILVGGIGVNKATTQRIRQGKQTLAVYTPGNLRAQAAAKLAVTLALRAGPAISSVTTIPHTQTVIGRKGSPARTTIFIIKPTPVVLNQADLSRMLKRYPDLRG